MINWTDSKLKLSQLEPWVHNPKSISKSAVKRFLSWWKRIGQFQNLAVGPENEKGLHPLYDGHQRLSILLAEYGTNFEVSVKISNRLLTEDERAEFVIMAHTGATGEYDWDLLSGWDVESLQSWGMDDEYLRQLNRDTAALIDMLGMGELLPNEFPEYDESIADDVEYIECPHCGEKFPK